MRVLLFVLRLSFRAFDYCRKKAEMMQAPFLIHEGFLLIKISVVSYFFLQLLGQLLDKVWPLSGVKT